MKEVRGRVGNSVEQEVGERADARGRMDAAGDAQQRKRGKGRRAAEAAGDEEVRVELVDVGRLPLPARARRHQRVRTHPFHTSHPLPHRQLCYTNTEHYPR